VVSRKEGIEDASSRRYFHQGIAAGPTLITDGGGNVVDERRSEPFGQPIDANMAQDPYNSLNKETNKETGWSYHGARWMAPQTARWLTPDPPVKGPDTRFTGEPWGLNPYAYVQYNPTTFWDPDGKELRLSSVTEGAAVELLNLINSELRTARLERGRDLQVRIAPNINADAGPSARELAFLEAIGEIIRDKGVTVLSATRSDPDVTVDSFRKGQIDVADLRVLAKAGAKSSLPPTVLGLFAHTVREQFAKQREGKTAYPDAHAAALKTEEQIEGWSREGFDVAGRTRYGKPCLEFKYFGGPSGNKPYSVEILGSGDAERYRSSETEEGFGDIESASIRE